MSAIERFEFDGDVLGVMADPGEGALVGVRSLCAALGVDQDDWSVRVQEVPALGSRQVLIGRQMRTALPIDSIPFVLGAIAFICYQAAPPAKQKKFDRYIRECAAALARHFKHKHTGVFPNDAKAIVDLLVNDPRLRALIVEGDEASFAARGHTMHKRIEPLPQCLDALILVVSKGYDGECPDGCGRVIVKGGKLVRDTVGKAIADVDHWYVRSDNRIESLWLLFRACHVARGDSHSLKWHKLFYTFQEHVVAICGRLPLD